MNDKSKKLIEFLKDDMRRLCAYSDIIENANDRDKKEIIENLLDELEQKAFYWGIHLKEIEI